MTKTGLWFRQNRTWHELKQYLVKVKTGLDRNQNSICKQKPGGLSGAARYKSGKGASV
jgi:hypothetical protein